MAIFYPRNVIVKHESDQRMTQVVLIDFGWSILGRTRNPVNIEDEKNDTYLGL